jgi:glycosyltransferase involved in cell wall biosynthesis
MAIESTVSRHLGHAGRRSAGRDSGERSRAGGRHIAFLVSDLNGGGVQKTTLTLAGALAQGGHRVDLIVLRPGGALTDQLPAGVNVVGLKASSCWFARLQALAADPGAIWAMLRPVLLAKKISATLVFLPPLVRYLRAARPQALVSATPHLNIEALWARRLAGTATRVLISERSAPSQKLPKSKNWRHRHLPALMRRTYPQADVIVAVSNALAEDLAQVTGLPRQLIRTIYNPIVGPELLRNAEAELDHPWLRRGEPPLILGVGRLTDQKDFPTLLRAFARVRAKRPARLVILGGAKDEDKCVERQAALREVAAGLGVAEDVDLPGFAKNPFAFMARAKVFVLSSRFEGLPGALIQALACGCQVVSTDCPTGPAEILENGRYGALVSMGDDMAMAQAIEDALEAPLSVELLRQRASEFSEDRAVDTYLDALFGEDVPPTALQRPRVATA